MPRYDYRCESCQYQWEQQLPIARRDEPVEQPCPQCGCTENTVYRFLPSTNGISYTTAKIRVPDTFTDLLKRIEKNTPGGKINTGHFTG